MDTRPIGVFDSGLGGLTAVRQLRRVLPGEDIVYFGDTGRVPYGSRGRDIIVQYARQDIRFLLQQDVKFIIAACGTVSSTYPPEEAARLPVPFTGVVGATARAAVDATRNRKIGIIGTAATVRSGSYAAIIRAVWGYSDYGSVKKLQVNMKNIRKKMGVTPGEKRYIINELGVGYRMLAEDEA